MRPTTGPYGSGGDMHETAAEELARTERGLATHSGVALSWLSELSGDEELISEVTTTRFLMLGCFCAASFGSALGWLSYAPIANLAEQHFDVGPGWMNFASNLFLVLYIPGSVVSLWATEAYGLKTTIVSGVWLSFLMCLIKWIGALMEDPHMGFGVTLVGQVAGAFGQPLLLNVAARLSMDWFPEHERDYATTAATMSNVVGQMVASFVPPLIVSARGIAAVQLYQVYFFVVVLVMSLALLPEKPLRAPSPAAAIQWAKRAQNPQGARDAFWTAWSEVCELCRNDNFLLLMSGFAVATGAGWALLILEQQVVTPCGYSDEFAGILGAALLGTGVICAFVMSGVMEKTKEYVLLQKGTLVLYAVAMAAVYGNNRVDNRVGLLASWCFVGALLQPLMPLTLEHAAEISYPLPADSSTALLLIGANVIGMILVFVLTPLLELPVSSQCTSVFTPAATVVCSLVVVGMALTLFVRKDNRRQAAEHARNLLDLAPDLRQGLIGAHQQHTKTGGARGGKAVGATAGALGRGDDPAEPLLGTPRAAGGVLTSVGSLTSEMAASGARVRSWVTSSLGRPPDGGSRKET